MKSPTPAPAAQVAQSEREFDAYWKAEKERNGGAMIGADYRHWALRGYQAALARPVAQSEPILDESRLRELLTAAGNASFDCGEYDGIHADPYKKMARIAIEKREAVVEFFRAALASRAPESGAPELTAVAWRHHLPIGSTFGCGNEARTFQTLETLADADEELGIHGGRIEPLFAAPVAVSGAVAELDRIKRVAACGTAESFLSLPEQDKRYWFAVCSNESVRCKLAEERFAFLHSANRDADGWEWGVARVRVHNGTVSHLWGASDHSDIDAAIAAAAGTPAIPPAPIATESTDLISEARAQLESKWEAEGDCGSCGWHACLYEHGVDDEDIAYALEKNGGILELTCISKDADEPSSHRGVKINIATPVASSIPPSPSTPLADLWMHEDMDRDATESVASLPRKQLQAAYKDARADLMTWRRRALEAESKSPAIPPQGDAEKGPQ